MGNYRIAYRYGTALLQSAEEAQQLEETARNAEMIAMTVRESRELRRVLASPVIEKEKKKRILAELFERRIGSVMGRFLNLLSEKDREGLLLDIIEQFLYLFDEKRGILRVQVTSAVELTESEQTRLKEQLKLYTGKEVIPSFRVDPSVLGGFVVHLDDRVIDASLAHQLNLLRDKFLEGTVASGQS